MDLDKELVAHIITNGNLQEVIDAGVTESDLFDRGRKYFSKILKHYTKYQKIPDRKMFREICGVMLKKVGKGDQPLQFYLDKIRDRKCQLLVSDHQQEISRAIQDQDWKKAAEVIYKSSNRALELASASEKPAQEIVTMDDLADERIEEFKLARSSKDGITGYRFPWMGLNEISGGFHKKNWVMFTGETGLGKTWVLCALLVALRSQGKKILVFSREMSVLEMQFRITCLSGGFNHDEVIKGRLTKTEAKRYYKHERTFWKDDPFIFAADNSFETYVDVERMVKKYKPEIFAADGVYLFAKNTNAPLHERVGEASRKFRLCSLSNDCLGIGTAQLSFSNRKVGNEILSLQDLGMAKSQAFDATHFFALTQSKKMELLNRARIYSLKARRGKKRHIEINWLIDEGNFEQLNVFDKISENGQQGHSEHQGSSAQYVPF